MKFKKLLEKFLKEEAEIKLFTKSGAEHRGILMKIQGPIVSLKGKEDDEEPNIFIDLSQLEAVEEVIHR